MLKQKIPFEIKKARCKSIVKGDSFESVTPCYIGFKFVEIKDDGIEEIEEEMNTFTSYAQYNRLDIEELQTEEEKLLKKLEKLKEVKELREVEVLRDKEYKENQRRANMGDDFYDLVKSREELEDKLK